MLWAKPGAGPSAKRIRPASHGAVTTQITIGHDSSGKPVEFDVDAVHLLEREGHGGQFEIFEKVPLGRAPLWRLRRLFRRKRRFVGMPAEPPDWVADAMAERSSRRFRGRGKRRRKRRSAAERAEIAARTPEDIAAIRAERAAKRLAKEAGEASSDDV